MSCASVSAARRSDRRHHVALRIGVLFVVCASVITGSAGHSWGEPTLATAFRVANSGSNDVSVFIGNGDGSFGVTVGDTTESKPHAGFATDTTGNTVENAPPSGGAQAAARLFFRGRPLPECSSFLITEFGAHYLINRNVGSFHDKNVFLTFDLGYMRNRKERSALGGLLHVGTGAGRTGFGPAVRYRRWLSKWNAADLTVGLDVLGSVDPGGELGAPAPWVEAGVSVEDILALSVRGEHWKSTIEPLVFPDYTKGSKNVTTWHVGVKGCSYVGVAGTVVVGLLVIAIFAAFAGAD